MDHDMTPVRESSAVKQPLFQSRVVVDDVLKRKIANWLPEDLQNQYLVLYDDHQTLKKHCRREEDRIKRLQAEIVKERQRNKLVKTGVVTVADVRHDQQIEKLTEQIAELERLNTRLKNRLEVQRQQVLPSNTINNNSYRGVPGRIDTRLKRTQSGGGVVQVEHSRSGSPRRYGHSVLEETREEVRNLQDIIKKLNDQLIFREGRIDELKEELRIRDANFDDEVLKIRQQATVEGKLNIQENLDIIKVQRELREKAAQLTHLHGAYQQMEERQGGLMKTQIALQAEVERLASQLKSKEAELTKLDNQLRAGGAAKRQLLEQDSHLEDLKREVATLKETNEKLTSAAFNTEREREWREREKALRTQIVQLEATLRRDVGEKGEALSRVEQERDKLNEMEAELSMTRVKFYELQQKYDEVEQKMSFYSRQENGVDMSEVEEALVLVKQRRDNESSAKQLDFLQRVDGQENKDLSRRLTEVELEHAETVQELEKTRKMLFVQYRINNDYKAEVEAITSRLEVLRREADEKATEAAQLLDLRGARIRKLERQLRDVAYGTRQLRVETSTKDLEGEEELVEEEMHLTRGENLLEIHVGKLVVVPEAQDVLQDADPLLFATWDFYDFETQATGVMRGTRPDFDITAQYVVKVDDFFLHYLLKDSATIELHVAIGSEYRTLGAGQLVLRSLLERSTGEGQRLHSNVQLIGLDGNPVAMLEYWARLRVGMEQSLRLYRERSKALGYLTANERNDSAAIEAIEQRQPSKQRSANVLHVKIIRATGLRGRRADIQPSPYFVYKLFDLHDHDSNIVMASNEPQFNDHRMYTLPTGPDLERYLRSQHLDVFLFDDTDPEPGAYLGRASLPLLPLSQNKPLAGLFELRAPDGGSNGSLEVELRWQDTYITSSSSNMVAEPLTFMEGEKEQLANVHREKMEFESKPERLMSPKPNKVMHKAEPTPTKKEVPVSLKKNGVTLSSPSGSVVEEPTNPMHLPRKNNAPSNRATNQKANISDVNIPAPLDRVLVSSRREGSVKSSPANSVFEESITETLRQKEKPFPMKIASPPEISDSRVTSGSFSEGTVTPGSEQQQQQQQQKQHLDSDSDHVVIPNSTRQSFESTGERYGMDPADLVTIEVVYVELDTNCSLYNNQDVKLFVEYRLPGVNQDDTETPFSLPIPHKNQRDKKMPFNFSKTFRVDFDENYQRRQHLAAMLLPSDPMNGRIRFSVVSEPSYEGGECDELGHSFVSIRDILSRQRDYENEVVPIYSNSDSKEKLGELCLTVQMLDALRMIQEEIQQDT